MSELRRWEAVELRGISCRGIRHENDSNRQVTERAGVANTVLRYRVGDRCRCRTYRSRIDWDDKNND